ncbi:MAG: hypothetical protein ABIR96_01320 [Bdellovibrionota bacterium]
MKQRNATGSSLKIQFSLLTLSLVMGMSLQARAQDAAVVAQNEVATAVPATLVAAPAQGATTQSSPVVVAPAITSVPVNVTNNTATNSAASANDGASRASGVVGTTGYQDADATEIDSSKNSNGSGIQIFNLNNNKPSQDQANDQNNGNRADMLRRERIRQELLNESRMIEKIEEDRISTEGTRSTSIEGMQFAAASAAASAASSTHANGLEEVQVQAVATAASTSGSGAVVSTTSVGASDLNFSSTEFKISPMGGYRWTPNNDSYFRSQNQGVAGVAVEGRLANVLGLEVSYVYGRDKLRDRSYGPYGAYGTSNYNGSGNCGGCGGYNAYQSPVYSGSEYGFVQNVRSRDTHEFNANVKLGWFVGQVRPYAVGGIGTRYTAYNIDNSSDKSEAAAIGWKRSSARMTSNAGAGLDYRIARNMSVGTRVEWQYIFGKKTDYSFGGQNIIELYGDTKNNVKAIGSLQLVF